MHAGAAAIYFRGTMTAHDRQQQSNVDGVLRLVERTLASQQQVRDGIAKGRIRVDDLIRGALPNQKQDADNQHES